MRSAETSGASVTGFGTGEGKADNRRHMSERQTPAHRVFGFAYSPITVAVALTALLSATLFVIYDAARTFDDVRRDLSSIGGALVSEMVTLEPDSVITSSSERLASMANLVAIPQRASVELQGISGLETEQVRAWMSIAQRGAAAFGLAALFALFTMRRRSDMPDMVQRHNYQKLAAAIPMGVACWTQAGRLIACNEQYRHRLDRSTRALTYPEALQRLTAGGSIKLVDGVDGSKVLELRCETGACLLIEERPLGDGAFMTLISDVTEAKKTVTMLDAIRQEQRLLARRYHEEKLKAEAASRSKTNFLSHLSHDIRTPLNHIIGFAELMRHQTYGPLGDARYADYVQSIKSSGEHLLASFATILDLVELESGQKALRSDPVSVDELLDSVVQRFRGQATRAGVAFVQGAPSGAVVLGDRLGLSRMVANIVDNSLRFTPSGGRITLASFAARDGVVVEVTDTGLGMSEERLASLSQPFALGDATFTREGVGPGLGISISRAIAELSGGNLAIDSSPALGTTVAISLPLAAAVATPEMQAA
ncbi:sensor histidine kinase [Devosia sp. A449]